MILMCLIDDLRLGGKESDSVLFLTFLACLPLNLTLLRIYLVGQPVSKSSLSACSVQA